ncbi:MAG: NAD(P)-dependent oxidoreductase [Nitrososphaerota archaeon]|nr:NAD(P)-dependent oxidoreductase [Nitrososphaerota archaeon]MDG6923332.1 NAD(P)-dependent oxidoreductase [Nitrososphaerota archaeon]
MVNLIIGGTGFAAPYVIKELVDHGEEVVAADLKPDLTAFDHLGISGRVKIIKLDILNYEALLAIIKQNRVTKIADYASYRQSKLDPLELQRQRGGTFPSIRLNTEGVRNIFEAARMLDVEKVVMTSSTGVYGNLPQLGRPLTEDDPTAAVTTGYMAKRVGEMVCEEYNELYGLDCLVIRFGGQVYGPRMFDAQSKSKTATSDRLGVAIQDLFENGALGRSCKITEPDYVKSWIFVRETAKAVHSGLNSKNPQHRVFNAPGFVHTNREISEMVKRYVKDCKIEYVQGKVDRWDKRVLSSWKHAYEYSRIESELGWEPTIDIDVGVREFVNYARRKAGLPSI